MSSTRRATHHLIHILMLGGLILLVSCGSNSASPANRNTGTPASSAVSKSATMATATESRRASAPGVTADTITIGATTIASGPGAGYAPIDQTVLAYIQRVNDQGGVNGRKIIYKLEDDAYSPANTPPLTKKLVEQDHVFALMSSLGTATQSTVVDYLNENKIPQLFLNTGAGKWGDYKKYPWTMGFIPDYPDEARAYGKYITQNWPGKKVGILYQNDDFGKDFFTVKETLGPKNPVIDEESYEITVSDLNTQITNMRAKGVEVVLLAATTKFSGLALKAAADQGWKPNFIMSSVSADPTVFALAGGPQNAEGVITDGYYHQYDSGDPSIQQVKDLLDKYAPQVQLSNFSVVGYMAGNLVVETLRRAGVNPTRDSLLAAAESFDHYQIPQLLPGITISTSKTNHYPIRCVKLEKATSGKFTFFGDVICGG